MSAVGGHGHILGRHQAVDRALGLDARLGDPLGHVIGQQRPVRDQPLDELAHVLRNHGIPLGLGQRPAPLRQSGKALRVLGQPALARLPIAHDLRRETQFGRRGNQLFVGGIDHPARVGQIVGGDKRAPLAVQDALDAPLFGALFRGRRVGIGPLDDQRPAPDAVQDHRRIRGRVQADVIGHRGRRDQDVRRLAQQVVARVAEFDRLRHLCGQRLHIVAMRRGLGLSGQLEQAGHVQSPLAVQKAPAVAQADHPVAIRARALVQKQRRVGPHRAKALHDHPDRGLAQFAQMRKLGKAGQLVHPGQHRLQGDHHAARRRAALVDLCAAHARRFRDHAVQAVLHGNEGHVLVVHAHVRPGVVLGPVARDQAGKAAHRLALALGGHRRRRPRCPPCRRQRECRPRRSSWSCPAPGRRWSSGVTSGARRMPPSEGAPMARLSTTR